MKKLLSLLVVLSMLCSFTIAGMNIVYSMDGAGIANDPYIITTAEELSQISDGGYYKLGADLTVTTPLTGKSGFTLDGNNHIINLDIKGKGLFATLSGTVTIKNLVLKGKVDGNGAEDGTGALVGKIAENGNLIIDNVVNFADVYNSTKATDYLAGFIGSAPKNTTVEINNCENYGNIGIKTPVHSEYVAGFVGNSSVTDIDINSSYNYGNIIGYSYTAGFVFIYGGTSSVLTIDITNSGNYGYIEGRNSAGFISDTANTSTTATSINMSKSFNIGKVVTARGNNYASAFYAKNKTSAPYPSVTISDCFNFGEIVYNNTQSGNFTSAGEVINSYNIGNTKDFIRASEGISQNSYYLEGSLTGNISGATSKDESAFKSGLETLLSENFEYILNPDATENYPYPQIKTNRVYSGYKTPSVDNKEYEDMPASYSKGEITGATKKPFTYGEKLNSSEFSVISPLGTYEGVLQTDIVYGYENGFSINKSAVVYIADKDGAIETSGFTKVLSTDDTYNATVNDKYGVKYYLTSKTFVSDETSIDVSIPSGADAVLIKWLDNANLTIPSLPSNGTIKVKEETVTEAFSKAFIKGETVTVTVNPSEGYYLKALKVNGETILENIGEEENIDLILNKDTEITATFEKYEPSVTLKLNDNINERAEFIIDAKSVMANKYVTITIKDKDGNNLSPSYEKTTVLDGDGKVTLKTTFAYPSENYKIEVKLSLNGKSIIFIVDDENSSNGNLYYIPSVQKKMDLIDTLNYDISSIDKAQLAEDIETERDLNFDVNIYKNLSTLKTDIVTRFLSYNDGAYSVDNISERFAESVILEVMNNGSASEIKSVAEYYENEYLNLNSSVCYSDFGTVSADTVYSLMTNETYGILSDVKVKFEYSVIIALIKNTFNSGNILPILARYNCVKHDGTIDSTKDINYNILNCSEISTIDNYTDYRQRCAMNYLANNRSTIYKYNDLKTILEYITANINTIAPIVIPPSSGGGGGGGGSSTVVTPGGGGGSLPPAVGKAEDVTSKYGDITNDETSSKPTGEVIYYNDFSDEIVGESPMTVGTAGSAGSVIVSEDNEKGKCIKIINNSEGYEPQDITQAITVGGEPIALETEFQWLSGQDNVGIHIFMNNKNESVFNLFTNTSNSTLSFNNQAGTAQLFPGSGIPLKKGVWYKLRIVVDTVNKTVNFSVKSDAYKNLNANALSKSYTYDNATNTVASGMIPLNGDNIEPISKFIFRTARYKSEFLVSYIKIEKNPTDLIGKTEIKAPDAPTVADPVPHAVPGEINIKLNGKYVYSYIKPIMRNDRVLVSVRNILEMFKMEVLWDEETETVTAKDENNIVVLKNNDVNILVNGEIKTTDVPAQLYGDRIYVPLRFLSECFGMKVDWEDETQTVIIGG